MRNGLRLGTVQNLNVVHHVDIDDDRGLASRASGGKILMSHGRDADGAVHLHDLPPGRPDQIGGDYVFYAEKHIARIDRPAVALRAHVPARAETFWVMFGGGDFAA